MSDDSGEKFSSCGSSKTFSGCSISGSGSGKVSSAGKLSAIGSAGISSAISGSFASSLGVSLAEKSTVCPFSSSILLKIESMSKLSSGEERSVSCSF